MRALLRLGKRKRALSNVVGYVLLISITISLSVLVYGWLKFYVSEDNIETCPDGVNIIIRDYECNSSPIGEDPNRGYLSVTLKNKGLFKVDGYMLRVHDREDADFGFYIFDDVGIAIMPGEEYSITYNFTDNIIDGYTLKKVTVVEVQPFIREDGNKIHCELYTSQKIECR